MLCAAGLSMHCFAKRVNYKQVLNVLIPFPHWRKCINRFNPILPCFKLLKKAQCDLIWFVWMLVKFPCKPTRSAIYTQVPPCIVGPIFLQQPPKLLSLETGSYYFAVTFLSDWLYTLQSSEGRAIGPNQQALNYFESASQLQILMEGGALLMIKSVLKFWHPRVF